MNGAIPIYAFDIIDENNIINNELEREYRLASKNKLLTCCGCGSPIMFKFKNLDKMKPHFSHYSSSGNEGCSYGKETEEHIEGKKILLSHMRKLYPNLFYEMRYYIKSINRYADLYFKSDDKELIIEFQRTDLDVNTINEKFKDYKSLDVSILWVFSEEYDSLQKVLREYNLSFTRRSVLNNFNNRLTLLNVANKEITILSKMLYKDKETQRIVLDKIFHETYLLDDIRINLDGSIQSSFDENLKLAKNKFITDHEDRLRKEKEDQEAREKLRIKRHSEKNLILNNRLKEKSKKYDERIKKFDVREYIKNCEKIPQNNIKNLNSNKKSSMYLLHKKNIEGILQGEKTDLVNIICEGFKTNEDYVDDIIDILNIEIKNGNKKARNLLKKFESHR